MKIFEVEFVYDDYNKREANGVGSRKNPFRVRIPFPKNKEYETSGGDRFKYLWMAIE